MALTKDRDTPYREGVMIEDPVAAGATIYTGALAALDSSGYAVPGSTATGLTARGRAEEHVDNSGGSNGDKKVVIRQGIFRYANDNSDTVDRTHIGATAYIVDDETVAANDGGGTRSAAGEIVDVDSDGVWVRIE